MSRRASIVPSMAEVKIDTRNPAPESNLHSLDFDRVVNAYSIMHVKKRLVHHHNLKQQNAPDHKSRRQSQRYQALIKSYKVFQTERQDQNGDHRESLLHTPNGKKYAMWTLTVLLGLICGGVAVLLVYCTSHLVSFRTERLNWQLQWASGTGTKEEFEAYYHYSKRWRLFAEDHGMKWAEMHGSTYVLFEYMLYNAVLCTISVLLCICVAPNAVGSGIPEVKAYLNGVCVQFADLPVFLVKIVGTIFAVSSGLIVGPEGPLVHIGAIVGQGITKTTRLEMMLRKFRLERPGVASMFGCGNADEGGYYEDVKTEVVLDDLLHVLHEDLGSLYEDDDEEEDESASLISAPSVSYKEDSYQNEKPAAPSTESVNRTFWTETMAILSRFRNDGDRRDLISIGVATGFAAAFGAPVGGLLYSFEEASSFFTIPLMWRTLVATAIGTFVIALYHGDLSHFSVLSLGYGAESSHELAFNSFAELPFYVLIGAVGGLLGAFFNGCYIYTNTIRKQFYSRSGINKSVYRVCEVLVVSIVTSLVTFCLSVYLPQSWLCTDVNEEDAVEGVGAGFAERFNCPVGQFNEVASILLGSRDEALNDILTDPSKFEPRTLLVSGLTFLFLMVITFGIFIPSGLFMPTLLTGSSLSGWAGLMIQRHLLPSVVPAHMALVGATAMLAGVQRTTVSLCVIMMEATGQTKVLIPLIISVVVARYVGDLFNDGFYHIAMHMKELPYLEHEIKESFDICTVSDVMSAPVVTLKGVEEAQHIEKVLLTSNHQAFPVLDQDTNQYVGLIRRDQLVALLECGLYLESLEEHQNLRESMRAKTVLTRATNQHVDHVLLSDADAYSSDRKTAKLLETHEWLNDNVSRSKHGSNIIISKDETLPGGSIIPRRGSTVVDVNDEGKLIVRVAHDEKHMHVDVSAAMNRGAFTVMQNCPLSKAHSLFTGLGLRHLPVLGRDGSVVGIVARSNLNPEYMEGRTGLDMHH